ncbi:MAG TPA: hypothetical protein VGQ51_07550 [Puia sp.]|nr:hypothetical protein [Puia sp.]
MTEQEYNESMETLRESRRKALRSKAAARKFLKDAGVLHLLVPIDKPGKKKKTSTRLPKSR